MQALTVLLCIVAMHQAPGVAVRCILAVIRLASGGSSVLAIVSWAVDRSSSSFSGPDVVDVGVSQGGEECCVVLQGRADEDASDACC